MEQFISCAYAHFLSYGLRLSDRQEYSFEAVDLGNIAHQSLERFFTESGPGEDALGRNAGGTEDELIDESVEESVIDYGNTVLFSSARNEYMIARIKRLIRRSVWLLQGSWKKGTLCPGDMS